MKRLRVEYGGIVLFDSEVAEISWQDNEDGVNVTGKIKKSSSANLFDLLTGGGKKAEDIAEERKAEYEAEKAEKAAAKKAPARKAPAPEPVAAE